METVQDRQVVQDEQRGRPPRALVAGAVLAAGGAAAATLGVPGVLRGPAAMNGSARGTAVVMLAVVAVLLVAGLWPPGRRDLLTRVGLGGWSALATGCLAYLTYNAVLLLFATPFNRLFLLYVAALGFTGWTFVAALRRTRPAVLPVAAARRTSAYLAVVVLANALLWLRGILPSVLAPDPAAAMSGLGVATNPVWVQDLAVWLPAMALVAVGLWRGRPWAPALALAGLVFWSAEAVSIAVDQELGSRADPASLVVSAGLVPVFIVVAVVNAGVAWALAWSARRST